MAAAPYRIAGFASLVAIMLVLQPYVDALQVNRELILSGEIWRLWTGHLVHTNTQHFMLNISAGILLHFAFFTQCKVKEQVTLGLLFAPLISAALLYFYPEIYWYNGLSGLLHAWVAFYCLRLAINRNPIYWLGLGCLWFKVLIEADYFQLYSKAMLGDMVVITESHLLGALIGSAVGLLLSIRTHDAQGAIARRYT